MVYYGKVSKGCERCRQRKIKCDQRKPQYLRCEKKKVQCPGYRNLGDVIFRDESEAVIQKARALQTQTEQPLPQILIQHGVEVIGQNPSSSVSVGFCFAPNDSICPSLCQPINEAAAAFFFSNYSCDEPPLSLGYHVWLTQMYQSQDGGFKGVLRAAIEALGLAGISNISYAPEVGAKSKVQYGRALAATQRALSDPVEMLADRTLMAVILLGLFEFITFENRDQYQSWATHLEGATRLLRLRGSQQYQSQISKELSMLLRCQLLHAYFLGDIPATSSFVETLKAGGVVREHREKAKPGPLGDMSLRILDLHEAIRSRSMTNPKEICEAALEIDRDLESWTATLGPDWSYTTVNAPEGTNQDSYHGKIHTYHSNWAAQIWVNWRLNRILVNQIILQHDDGYLEDVPHSTRVSLIQQLSTDICVSVPQFIRSPRATGLTLPLFVVAQEYRNSTTQRLWAMQQLRRVSSIVGIRHITLLADTLEEVLTPCGTTLMKPTLP